MSIQPVCSLIDPVLQTHIVGTQRAEWQQGSHWKKERGTWHESKIERYWGLILGDTKGK